MKKLFVGLLLLTCSLNAGHETFFKGTLPDHYDTMAAGYLEEDSITFFAIYEPIDNVPGQLHEKEKDNKVLEETLEWLRKKPSSENANEHQEWKNIKPQRSSLTFGENLFIVIHEKEKDNKVLEETLEWLRKKPSSENANEYQEWKNIKPQRSSLTFGKNLFIVKMGTQAQFKQMKVTGVEHWGALSGDITVKTNKGDFFIPGTKNTGKSAQLDSKILKILVRKHLRK